MKNLPVIFLCLTLASCAGIKPKVADPIDTLVDRLNSETFGLWVNGTYPIIELPPEAKPQTVLSQAVKMTGFDQGHIKTYKMLEVREVELNVGRNEPYSAALVESDLGMKILLFKPERNSHWWTRFYSVPEEKQNN